MSRLSQAQVIRTMIRAATADDVVSGVLLDLLRREQEQGGRRLHLASHGLACSHYVLTGHLIATRSGAWV